MTCPSSSSGMVAIPGFYEKPRLFARRFEVEDLASLLRGAKWRLLRGCGKRIGAASGNRITKFCSESSLRHDPIAPPTTEFVGDVFRPRGRGALGALDEGCGRIVGG